MRNHAKAMVACDFAVAVTLRFQILYLFVVMDLGARRLLNVNTTSHPNSLAKTSSVAKRCDSLLANIGNAAQESYDSA